jgi:hypothetical protein
VFGLQSLRSRHHRGSPPSGPSVQYATSTAYDALNRPTGVSWIPAAAAAATGTGVTFTHTYNKANQRVSLRDQDNIRQMINPQNFNNTQQILNDQMFPQQQQQMINNMNNKSRTCAAAAGGERSAAVETGQRRLRQGMEVEIEADQRR